MWPPSPVDPPRKATYSQVLRTSSFSPVRSLMGVLIALCGYMLIVPLVSQLVILISWMLRGRPELASYSASAMAYELPEGVVAGHISLAMLIPISFAMYRYVHGVAPKWLASVQPGFRIRYLIATLLVALVVFLGLLFVSTAGGQGITGAQPDWLWFAVVIIIFSPLQAAAEEVFFRGYLFQAIGSLSAAPWLAVLLSALFFAFLHGTQNLALFTYRFVFGLTAGALVILTGGLEAGIAAHVVNNLLTFGFAIFSGGVAHAKAVQEVTWAQTGGTSLGFGLFAVGSWWVGRRMHLATKTP